MRSVIVVCAGVLPLGFAGVARQSGGTHAATPQPAVVSLMQRTNHAVPLPAFGPIRDVLSEVADDRECC